MIGAEKDTLANQYLFYAFGDLMFAELSKEGRKAFADRVKGELEFSKTNGGVFRDGSTLPEFSDLNEPREAEASLREELKQSTQMLRTLRASLPSRWGVFGDASVLDEIQDQIEMNEKVIAKAEEE